MNTQDIRINNMHDIISCLRESNGMTKKDLAEATHLSFSTYRVFAISLWNAACFTAEKDSLLRLEECRSIYTYGMTAS